MILRINKQGEMDLNEVEKLVGQKVYDWISEVDCVCLENTFQGRVLSLNYMKSVYDLTKKYNKAVHLDGARIFNAAASLGVEPKEIAKFSDSVSFCLSKGLCCPVGSILAGTKEFI